mgnify:FL=1
MTYSQTIDFLFNQITSFQQVGAAAYKPGLERVEEFCRLLGTPHNDYHTIHIAGTNGKGSTSHMLASVLQQAGYRVGLFTSPHLKDFRERVRVDGEMISEQEVVGFVERNMPEIKRLGLSFFEITAAMAFEHFSRQDVEVAVIETGLGGRLDATNIITPLVSVITNIGLDHTDLLGSTLQAVAAEKAGIIKRGIPVVLGERSEEYDAVFVKRAEELDAPLYFAQQQCRVLEQGVADDMQRFVLQRDRDNAKFDVKLDLMGEYQYNNLITASAALDVLDKLTPLTISRRAYLDGLQSVSRSTSLAGRWQVLSAEPYMVCDTGHNAHGIKYVAKQLQGLAERYSKLYCVVGFAKEKSLDEVLPLLPTAAYYIFTQASSPRALPAVSLAEQAAEFGLKGEVVSNVADAVALAQEKATAKDAIFIGGSNFIVGEIPQL